MQALSLAKRIKRNKKGFTLVELIVVLIIVAIIAAIAVPTFLGFMDMARNHERKNNAIKSLTATQTALSDLYADASSSLNPTKRKNVENLVDVSGSCFMVWTKNQLLDGTTKALPENIASYTIDRALYFEGGVCFYYDGNEWEKEDAEDWDDAKQWALTNKSVDNTKAIYMWPYSWDSAFLDTNPDIDINDNPEEDSIKVVVLNLDLDSDTNINARNRVYFTRAGKNVNSGIESIRVLFWKDVSSWKSTYAGGRFNVDGKDYEIHSDSRFTFTAWHSDVMGNVDTVDEIQSLVCNDPTAANYYEFNLVLHDNGPEDVEAVYISKSRFRAAIGNSANVLTKSTVTNINDVPLRNGSNGNPTVTRIDDESVLDGYAYAWVENGNLVWWTNAANVYMPADCSSMCAGSGVNVSQLDFAGFNFANTTNARSMFEGSSVTAVSNISNANNLSDVSSMFANCASLTNVDVDGLAGNITALNKMFYGCTSLADNGMAFQAGFDTSGISDFTYMFANSGAAADISAFTISDSANLESMFEGCKGSTVTLPSSGVKPGNLKNTFKGSGFNTLDFTGWDMTKVITLEGTFKDASSLTGITVDSWDLATCTNMDETFMNCKSLSNSSSAPFDAGKIITSKNLTTLKRTFAGCYSLSEINLDRFYTSNVTDMTEMFAMNTDSSKHSVLKDIKFGATYDTARVGSMNKMFYECESLETLEGIDKFKTFNVNDMEYMFAGDSSLTELDLSSFETNKVNKYDHMFEDTTSLATIYASPRFVVKGGLSANDIFNGNDVIVGGRGTAISEKKTEVESDENAYNNEDYKKLEFAKIDGWEGEEGYFTGKYREVYIDKNAFKGLFGADEELIGISKVPTNAYSIAEVRDKDGVVSIKDTSNGHNTYYYIFAWKENNNVYWWTDADVAYLPQDSSYMLSGANIKNFDFTGLDVTKITKINNFFEKVNNLENVEFGKMFYLDKTTNTTSMFFQCPDLVEADLTGLNFSGKNISNMYKDCKKLTTVDISGMDFGNATLSNMFDGCTGLTSVDMSGANLSNTKLSEMFKGCSSLETANLAGLNLYNTSLSGLFNGCVELKTVDISGNNFDGANLSKLFYGCAELNSANISGSVFSNADISNMFYGCAALANMDLSNADFENSKLSNMFEGCTGLTSVDMSGANLSNVTISNIFKGCSSLETANLANLTLSNTPMSGLFNGCSELKTVDISGNNFDGANLSKLFYGCAELTSVNITGSVFNNNNISSMFEGCTSLTNNSVNFASVDFKNVTNMQGLFKGCTGLTGIKIENLSINSTATGYNTVTKDMFYGCDNLKTIDFPAWSANNRDQFVYMVNSAPAIETLKVPDWEIQNLNMASKAFTCMKKSTLKTVDMSNWDFKDSTTLHQAFYECSNLESLDLSGWKISKVTTLEDTFHGCTNLRTLDLTGWGEGDNLSSVTNMTKTFRGLQYLTKITMGSDEIWDLKNVTIMRTTFENCESINQDFGFIHLSNKLTFISWTFKNCKNITTLDLSNWDTTSVSGDMQDTFDGCAKLTTIYVSDKFVITQRKRMFPGCSSLVGGSGTRFADMSDADNSKYAKIDGGESNPGYFTLKQN